MSDRRPSKLLYVQRPVPGGVWDFQPADDSEVLAHVRRGVESGEIEGEVVWFCVLWENRQGVSEPCEPGSTHDGDAGCYWRMVIPVTDDGEGEPK